ncbi:MAG: hypothetical protein PHR00_01335 [Patescibacteria group bacterium]|nr:hypothetical protein [Patescibacteria group bacterium]
MNKKLICNILLIVGGFLLGWYALINAQLYLAVRKSEITNSEQSDRLQKIEDFLKKSFPQAMEQGGAKTEENK